MNIRRVIDVPVTKFVIVDTHARTLDSIWSSHLNLTRSLVVFLYRCISVFIIVAIVVGAVDTGLASVSKRPASVSFITSLNVFVSDGGPRK